MQQSAFIYESQAVFFLCYKSNSVYKKRRDETNKINCKRSIELLINSFLKKEDTISSYMYVLCNKRETTL